MRCRNQTPRSLKEQHLCTGDTQGTNTHVRGASEKQWRENCGKKREKLRNCEELQKNADLNPLCDIPSGCCSFTGPWTVTRSSLRMLRRVAAFCRPLRPVLLLVSFPRSRSPAVGVLGLCRGDAPPPLLFPALLWQNALPPPAPASQLVPHASQGCTQPSHPLKCCCRWALWRAPCPWGVNAAPPPSERATLHTGTPHNRTARRHPPSL